MSNISAPESMIYYYLKHLNENVFLVNKLNSDIFALAYMWQEEILGLIEALINYCWNKVSRVIFDRLITDGHISIKTTVRLRDEKSNWGINKCW